MKHHPMLRWRVIAAATLFFVFFLGACGGGHSSSGEADPGPTGAAVKRAATLIGYGLVNAWDLIEPSAFADELAENGLTLTEIEWAPWSRARESGCQNKASSSATFPEKGKAFVREMRSRDVTTLINVVNWNGCAQRRQPDTYMRGAVDYIAREIGTDRVILSGVSEPWVFGDSGKALRWTRIARAAWAGSFLIADKGRNSHTGRPYWGDVSFDLLDVHYCSDTKLVAALKTGDQRSIANTDCTPIINPGPERAAAFTRLAVDHGASLLIYDFRGEDVDSAVIAAMGEEIRR